MLFTAHKELLYQPVQSKLLGKETMQRAWAPTPSGTHQMYCL